MSIRRLENVGIVVEDLQAVTAFFVELGLVEEGSTTVEGAWVDQVVGLPGVRTKIAMLRTPDGQGHLELMQFEQPTARGGERDAPPNTLGLRRLAFSVEDVDASVALALSLGATLLGEVVQYENHYRLCYMRGPEGIMIMLAEKLD